MRPDSLSEMQLDALREVGNIGSSHAATALSQLVGKPVNIAVPEIELRRVTDVPSLLGGPEEIVAAAYFRLLGEIAGSILLVASLSTAVELVRQLHGHDSDGQETLDHDGQQMFTHVAFVQCSAYLAAIARMADLNVMPAPPQFALDMAGAILEVSVARLGMRADHVLLLRTVFIGEGFELDASLLFLPEPDGLDVLLGRLGLA